MRLLREAFAGRDMKQQVPHVAEQLAGLELKMVPGVGLEPTQPLGPRDFKSLVSTDSTIRASALINLALQR